MSERKFIIPEYGPFAGMRVVCSGSLVAMPFAATMLADFGAEVIQIERPGVGDTLRMLAPFAEVNGKTYSSLQAAINAAPRKATVKLLADTKENVTISTSDVTLDLNG